MTHIRQQTWKAGLRTLGLTAARSPRDEPAQGSNYLGRLNTTIRPAFRYTISSGVIALIAAFVLPAQASSLPRGHGESRDYLPFLRETWSGLTHWDPAAYLGLILAAVIPMFLAVAIAPHSDKPLASPAQLRRAAIEQVTSATAWAGAVLSWFAVPAMAGQGVKLQLMGYLGLGVVALCSVLAALTDQLDIIGRANDQIIEDKRVTLTNLAARIDRSLDQGVRERHIEQFHRELTHTDRIGQWRTSGKQVARSFRVGAAIGALVFLATLMVTGAPHEHWLAHPARGLGFLILCALIEGGLVASASSSRANSEIQRHLGVGRLSRANIPLHFVILLFTLSGVALALTPHQLIAGVFLTLLAALPWIVSALLAKTVTGAMTLRWRLARRITGLEKRPQEATNMIHRGHDEAPHRLPGRRHPHSSRTNPSPWSGLHRADQQIEAPTRGAPASAEGAAAENDASGTARPPVC